ncbi:aldehyde dehydrogenase family protein [Dasania marina]|uniref:aldehyde dehydrogenase family protein n=1 Tax=Dasania marina TaxID=471499 RepID=UPI0030D9BD96
MNASTQSSTQPSIQEMLAKARTALQGIEHYSQEQIDALVRAVGKMVFDNAEELAIDTFEETEMGNIKDKTLKNQGKSRNVWNYLKGKKSVGIIEPKNDQGMVTIAKPVGVVGAVIPTTSPVMTIMCNAMFALKGGNSLIVAPHPRAKKTTLKATNMINAELKKLGAPDNLIQCIAEPSLPLTNELMSSVDVLVATGGPAMVAAAYSSGKPSFGVGAGNVQTIFDSGIDHNSAASKVITGRAFDNGIICSGDQTVIAPRSEFASVIAAFKANGAFYSDDQNIADKFRKVIFENGYNTKEVVGQTVQTIAKLAGVEVPEDTRVIMLKSNGDADDVLRSEKMCPVLAAFEYDTLDEAIAIARANLEIKGKGHTCAIHSNSEENIAKIGLALPVSRVAVNEPASLSVGGSLKNGFIPTGTLGCGSWGNNSISENFNYKHMINTQRIGYTQDDKYVPSDAEIWG